MKSVKLRARKVARPPVRTIIIFYVWFVRNKNTALTAKTDKFRIAWFSHGFLVFFSPSIFLRRLCTDFRETSSHDVVSSAREALLNEFLKCTLREIIRQKLRYGEIFCALLYDFAMSFRSATEFNKFKKIASNIDVRSECAPYWIRAGLTIRENRF